MDRLAELAVFTGCSSAVVCITSYHQCAESEIFEALNIEFVNKVIILCLTIYYRKLNCAILGNYASSSANFYRRFEITYRSALKGSL